MHAQYPVALVLMHCALVAQVMLAHGFVATVVVVVVEVVVVVVIELEVWVAGAAVLKLPVAVVVKPATTVVPNFQLQQWSS